MQELTAPKRRRRATPLSRILKKYKLGRAEVCEALAHQMTEHLCEVMTWTEATYEFVEGEPPAEHFEVGQLQGEARLAAGAVVMEALRRADEWLEIRKVVGRGSDIYVRRWEEIDPGGEATLVRVFAEIDGRHTVREIIDATRLGAFAVYKALADLLREDAVAVLTCAKASEWAQQFAQQSDWDAALRYAEFVLAHEPHHIAVLDASARAHQAVGSTRDAVARYRQLGTLLAEGDNLEEGLEAFRQIVELAPADLLAHERILELLLTLGQQDEALAAIEGMTEAAEQAGLPDKLAPIYVRLLDSIGEDRTLLEALASLERRLGKTVEAIDLYERLLRRARSDGDDAQALELCDTILQLDPSRGEADRTRQRLQSGIEQKARERRRMRRVVVPLVVLLLLVAAAGTYELVARSDLANQRDVMLRATVEGRHDEALRHYDAFVAKWPFTFAARELTDERRRVEPLFVGELEQQADQLRGAG